MVPALQDGVGFHPGAGAFSAVSAEHTPSPVVVTPVKRGKNVRRFTELPCGGLQGTRRAQDYREHAERGQLGGPPGLIQARLTVTIL